MFIRVTSKKNGKRTVRLMNSSQVAGKVKQRTVYSFGVFTSDSEIEKACENAEKMRIDLENLKKPALPSLEKEIHGRRRKKVSKAKNKDSSINVKKKSSEVKISGYFEEKKRVVCGLETVFSKIYEKSNFSKIIEGTKRDKEWNYILRSCVLSRIFNPESKRSSVETLSEDFNKAIPLDRMYRMMDRLHPHIEKSKALVTENTLNLFSQEVDVLLYDVTTLSFESLVEDELRSFGFSKDGKFKEVQVVLALVSNSEGHPISYELFPGRTSEGSTLVHCIENLQKRFKVKKCVVVADRGMFSRKNLEAMEEQGIEYVVATKLRKLPKAKKEEVLSFNSRELVSVGSDDCFVQEFEHEEKRLIVSYSPRRRKKDKAQRDRLIERLLKRVKKEGIPVKQLIPNRGTKKFIKIKNTKAILDEKKIEKDARWDGLHGVMTNVRNRSAKELLNRYRRLWKIEEAFRVNKNDLKMRPIFHWKKSRIEAHIALCFLAYSISYTIKYNMEQTGIKLSFERMRKILKRDQYSILEDTKTKALYKMPSRNTAEIESVYRAFGLSRDSSVSLLSN